MKRIKCSIKSDNHSEDTFEVWHGKPEPTYLCGYHYQTWSYEREKKNVPQKGDKKTLDTAHA